VNFFYPLSLGKGSGSSSRQKAPGFKLLSQIDCIQLDEFLNLHKDKLNQLAPAIFWFDVEGQAFKALEGAINFLKQCVLLKVEVEFRRKKPEWNHSNFLRIVKFMYRNGFRLYQSDLQPTRRGDLIFIKKEISRRYDTKILFYALVLHLVIYSITEFPRKMKRELFEGKFNANC
jgi:hypothetical protein